MIEIKEEDIEVIVEKEITSTVPINKSQILIRLPTEQAPQLKQQILQDHEDAKKWRDYIERHKNDKCSSCNSKEIVKTIDWITDLEESIETFYCKKCHNRWTGGLV